MFDRETLLLTAKANRDVAEAVEYYESARRGLGQQFIHRLVETIDHVITNPESFAVLHRGIRRACFRQFPYGVFFRLRGDSVRVVAIINLRRDPRTWQTRS